MQLNESKHNRSIIQLSLWLIGLVLGCMAVQLSHAASVIQIKSADPNINYSLSSAVDVLAEPPAIDAAQLSSVQTLLEAPLKHQFYPLDLENSDQLARLDPSLNPLWLRFALNNQLAVSTDLWLSLQPTEHGELQLYQAIYQAGQLQSLTPLQRIINEGQARVYYPLLLPSNSTSVFLLSLPTEPYINTDIQLLRPESVLQSRAIEAAYLSSGLGMILLLSMVFYSISIDKKSWLFFFFANYTICMAYILAISYVLQKSWFSEYHGYMLFAIYLFTLLANSNGLLLVREYLRLLGCLGIFDKLIIYAMIISSVLYVVLLLAVDQPDLYTWFLFVVSMPLFIVASGYAAKKSQSLIASTIFVSRLFTAAFMFFALLYERSEFNYYLILSPIPLAWLLWDLVIMAYCLYWLQKSIYSHRQHNQQLLQINEVKHKAQQQVFSQLSQDLRTPMSAIIGTSEIIKNTATGDEELQRHIEGIEKSAHSVLNKITDIYHRTKSFQESEYIETAPFEIHYLIEQCVEGFSNDIKKRALELILDIDPNIQAILVGNSFYLRTILVELLENAVQATSQGHIILRAESDPQEPEKILFTIEDTGRGIESSLLEKLNQHQRLEAIQGNESSIELVKQLLLQLDSRLYVNSQIGEGSSFGFSLYLPVSQMSINNSVFDSASLQAKSLLIVDDNHTYSRVLRAAAQSWGLESKEVYDGTEALALFRAKDNLQQPFDAIIIDNDIPNMPAIEVIRRIRESASHLPAVIMLAGFSPAPSMDECKQAGIDMVLTKPVSQRLIQTSLVNLLDTQRQQQSLMYQKPRILIAEDNDVSRRVISKMMEILDVDYKLVSDGKLAVDAVKKETYDLILMDCEMPIMNGFEAAAAIQQWQQVKHHQATPIVALTAHVFEEHEQRSISAGMQDFLEKPIKLDALTQLIDKYSKL
ncbi:MAG: response regulator [Pseudomonadales bacterium]|nr:response regulator [Pseudomonadales bacterium]